jgi:hypothetical protein
MYSSRFFLFVAFAEGRRENRPPKAQGVHKIRRMQILHARSAPRRGEGHEGPSEVPL